MHSQKKKKKLLNYIQRATGGMVDDASILLGVSLFGTEFLLPIP
jgi:hypothetical protein